MIKWNWASLVQNDNNYGGPKTILCLVQRFLVVKVEERFNSEKKRWKIVTKIFTFSKIIIDERSFTTTSCISITQLCKIPQRKKPYFIKIPHKLTFSKKRVQSIKESSPNSVKVSKTAVPISNFFIWDT